MKTNIIYYLLAILFFLSFGCKPEELLPPTLEVSLVSGGESCLPLK